MKEEIFITNIPSIVLEKEELSTEVAYDKWRMMSYETFQFKGTLIYAFRISKPKSLTIQLNAKGRYHIYLGMVDIGGDATTGFRMSTEEEISHVSAGKGWPFPHCMEENYWRTVDLDGQSLIISKPSSKMFWYISNLAWIRLVPAEAEEIKQNQCVAYHCDTDFYADDVYPTEKAAMGRINAYAGGGADIIMQEMWNYTVDRKKADPKMFYRAYKYNDFDERAERILKTVKEKAHSIGAKAYLTYRLQAGNFCAPHDEITLFANEEYPFPKEQRCQTRDGRWIDVYSYAYPEVRKYIIDVLVKISKGLDGVSLCFHRGTFVAFEKPIRDMVMEKYGVDACKLPMSDPRYNECACHFVTIFMRELRSAMDKEYGKQMGINAIVHHTISNSKACGLDVETWSNEGLVTSVSQGKNSYVEKLDDCLDENGFVDIDKYKALLETEAIFYRDFHDNHDLLVEGAKEFLEICGEKVDFYAALTWEWAEPDTEIALIDKLKGIGVKKFLSWNAIHKAKFLHKLNVDKYYLTGNEKLYEKRKVKYFRIFSFDGKDLSQYDPNWKG